MKHVNGTQKTLTSAIEELSAELGISEADFGGRLEIEGKDPVVASRHHLGESTSVLLALFGMELAAIWKQRTERSQDLKVNVRNAVCNLAALFYARHNGITVPFDDVGLEQTTDFFRCKDGRWVYIVCSLPHLRQRACAVLGCQATRAAFVDRCMRWNADLLEEAMNAVGASCAMVRTREEWMASEQGKITMADPLISIERIGDSDPIPFAGGGDLPLTGIRVLDNTHIYAGPICARYLSDAGADVLHLVPPSQPNPPRADSDVSVGKRSAWCDLTNPIMQDQFWKLVKDADVWVNSYLHLDRYGVSPQQLAAVKPGIICVELRGYGFKGAWAERGGFEQHGQSVTGFSANEGAPDSPRNPPTYLLNDVMTGIEGSIGMLEALRRRARDGGSYLVRVTLARNCSWLQDFGLFPASEVHGVGLPESMLASPGLNARLRPEFDLPTVTSTGPLGEMSVLPPQVEFSEFKLGPRFSGDPNGASKLDWSVFTREMPEKRAHEEDQPLHEASGAFLSERRNSSGSLPGAPGVPRPLGPQA